MESTSNACMNARKHQQRQDMLNAMNSFRKLQTFCDVVLVVKDRRFSAHKVVLAASSPVFKALFTSELTREKANEDFEVNVPDFDPNTVEELLNFVYTGEVGITEKNAEELLKVADYYDISNLKELCAEILFINLKPSNCLGIQEVAELYCYEQLHEAATDFICNNLTSIWQTEEYLSLDFDYVNDLFSGERLAIKTQKGAKDVFEGIKAWVKHEPEKRKLCFEKLFRHVHFSVLSLNFIQEVIDPDELVSCSHECQNLVRAVLSARGVTESIVLLSKNGCVSCYIPPTKAWFDLARVPSYNQMRAVTVCEGCVYAVGWEDDRMTIEKFDPRKNQWLELLSEVSTRPVAAVSVKDSVFILKENCVSCFKPADSSWQDLAPMDSVRRGLCAAALNGVIYAIGGHDELRNLETVEKYDPTSNQWKYVAPTNEQRSFASATVMGNRILVVGGTGDCFLPLSNCELYDPSTDAWSLLPAELNVPRSNAAVGKAKSKIFVFGGTYTNGIVECYDKDKETWGEIGRIPTTMNASHACVTWFPKALFKSLKGDRLLCDQQNG